MEVILKKNVDNLGYTNEVVSVKHGYGRNFLIPQRKARRATTTAVAEFEAKRADLEKAAVEKLAGKISANVIKTGIQSSVNDF